ncbi:helix-turn-helix domain-containing protein [Paenibacillus apii]|uniref:helix-turn-helix domain-containing protein n=1 Tax=Paenibacillus apii TaxID=1850370 RepID=UPI00143AC749|nr:helix-turn-helix transcriptional regulator [Paenibacillus apii]NJJ37873.1 helix-turn-helix transcriptional regulator [Paenibacillus apii]
MSISGDRIKKLREAQGLSQLELADRIGINNSVLSRIESGKRPVEDSEINQFADFFDVSGDYILGRTNDPKPFKPSLSFYGGPNDWTEEEFKAADDFIKEVRKAREKAIEKLNKEK